jgi:RNA polymerase sigma factor for flagellar operon FliA
MGGNAELISGRRRCDAAASAAHGRVALHLVTRSPASRLKVQAERPGLSRDELVARYDFLVKYVVGRLAVSIPGVFDREDAMQVGALGLLRAIDGYKPETQTPFESYAIVRIRGSILDAVRELDMVGRSGREVGRAIMAATGDLQRELARMPMETEIAARLGMPVARYRERRRAAFVVTVSLDDNDARDEDGDPVLLADRAPDPNAVDPAEEAARRDAIVSLGRSVDLLCRRSRLVLSLHYRDDMTFKSIGGVLGVTESRASQIHAAAIVDLRCELACTDVAVSYWREPRLLQGDATGRQGASVLQIISAGG